MAEKMNLDPVDDVLKQHALLQVEKKQKRYRMGQRILFLFAMIYTVTTGYMAGLHFTESGEIFSFFSVMMCIGIFLILKYLLTAKLDLRPKSHNIALCHYIVILLFDQK